MKFKSSQSQNYVTHDRRSVGQSILVSNPIWGPRSDFSYCQRVGGLLMRASSLMRGRACRLQLLQALIKCNNSRVRVPRDSRPHFIFRFETHSTWRTRSLYLYPPEAGWPSYKRGHCAPFSSPRKTICVTLEVVKLLLALVITAHHWPRRKRVYYFCSFIAVKTCLFAKPLLSSGFFIVACFVVVA
jgi:hypothetical protein